MKFSRSFRVLGIGVAMAAMLGLAACGEEGAGEKAGKKLDKAGAEISKSMDDMKKKLGGK